MKRDDYDPRGHNFNMIDVAPGGARRVRQFFKPLAADQFVEVEASSAEELVNRLTRSHFRQLYSVRRLTWKVNADQEGDGRNELTYSGLIFNRPADVYDILLPEDDLDGGQALPYHSLSMTPVESSGSLTDREFDGQKRTFVCFGQRPTETSPVEFSLENYTLNAYSMDRREAVERGLVNPERDWLDFLLMDAVDELCFEAAFPPGFAFDAVRVEVLEPLERPDVVHQSQLVQLMGGRLWLESEAGQGSTFHFTASFALAIAPAVTTTTPDAVDLRNVPVLVVDDNATNRRLLEEMLIGWQMAPRLAASVSEALTVMRVAQASGTPFRLVLTDAQMPEADGFTLAEAIKKDPAIRGATVVMLTSAGQPGDAARCRELGIAAYLIKPIKRSELRVAIQVALGGPSAGRDRLVTRHSLREERRTGRILLVEDNVVNQLVASRLLEKRGHTVVVANNGREALAILDQDALVGFGCVLMDVQLPEMDGFECTRIIRDREQMSGSRLPIIAMTAHAMKGDDVRCLAAGMDGYLSKPIDPDELFDAVERHLGVSIVPVARATLSLP